MANVPLWATSAAEATFSAFAAVLRFCQVLATWFSVCRPRSTYTVAMVQSLSTSCLATHPLPAQQFSAKMKKRHVLPTEISLKHLIMGPSRLVKATPPSQRGHGETPRAGRGRRPGRASMPTAGDPLDYSLFALDWDSPLVARRSL